MTLCSNLGCLGTDLELHCQIAVISNNTLRPYQNPSLRQKTDSFSAKSFFFLNATVMRMFIVKFYFRLIIFSCFEYTVRLTSEMDQDSLINPHMPSLLCPHNQSLCAL